MQNAPSVSYPVGRCVWYGWLLVTLGFLQAVVWGLWGWQRAADGWPLPAAGAAVCVAWCWMAWRSWRQPMVGRLHWDALAPGAAQDRPGGWLWHAGPETTGTSLTHVDVAFDGQTVAWLRLGGAAGVPRWVCVQQASDPPRWNDLRRAWTQGLR
jgi:hypothetical protein